jgi:acyl carrier protein
MSLEESLHQYILKHHLPGEDPKELTLETPLIEMGVLDSLAMMQMIVYFEKEHGIKVAGDQITDANFGNILKLADFIKRHQNPSS